MVVFQDMFTKWPMVFPVPDQRTERIARLLCEEIVPFFGVPKALLTNRGTNFLSHLMRDVCPLLGTEKRNTMAYHPECDGMVERFNRTLKSMLRKRVAQFGAQWDIDTWPLRCGRIVTRRTSPPARNPRFYSSVGIVDLQLRQHSYLLRMSPRLQ